MSQESKRNIIEKAENSNIHIMEQIHKKYLEINGLQNKIDLNDKIILKNKRLLGEATKYTSLPYRPWR